MGVHVVISGVEQPLFGSLTSTFRSLTDKHPSRPPGRTASLCRTGKCVTFFLSVWRTACRLLLMENQSLTKWCYNPTVGPEDGGGGGSLQPWLCCKREQRVMWNHYASLKWCFVGKALSISHSANYHAAVQNTQLFARARSCT